MVVYLGDDSREEVHRKKVRKAVRVNIKWFIKVTAVGTGGLFSPGSPEGHTECVQESSANRMKTRAWSPLTLFAYLVWADSCSIRESLEAECR